MFDISWTEFLLIGIVALVVIGPKELPGVMRTIGQYTRKIRGMAADFQNQFQEAMREAEMADLKKQVDDMASDIKSYDPLKSVRDDFETAGKDIEKSITAENETKLVEDKPNTDAASAPEALPPAAPAAVPAPLPPAPEPGVTGPLLEQSTDVAAPAYDAPMNINPVSPDPVSAEPVSGEPASTERTG
ncbi:MAG TPA: Sec-independent protein translocase protein TatB [Xanthobacteraceae bacterium]|jgi:sec-independent protein translocase protein TatB